ncbi:response regulator [Pseudomonas viridiflava]|uniref:response regulator n=1 Tax=Pseudomonas viridiflava TaxID=33069 RepID=UPI000C075D5D|nr:response regulator [Pseudomonas viridiflava]MEE4575926.1 response regulator [Pseudomonas alliivorans]MEE4687531.1 response regulator [Pseudomonas alliivorans]MEE4740216.1 response regulator [Pseudomonas alliivorans]MEE4918447.1 response regulator [Pseudomonas alliivorans]MEE4954507.1 response regulator [Pseudomonas alliivorans]
MSGKRILVVEDDADSASILEAYLLRDGFIVGLAENGQRGIDMHRQWKPDLVLLDVMLPLVSGTDVLSTIRRCSDTPVIMVTAMGDEPEKLGALRYGADDYVVKPYNPKEVVARVHAVLRRAQPAGSAERQLSHKDLVVDLEAFTARIQRREHDDILLDLTPTEFKILSTLLKTPSKAFTREELLEICLPESEALARVVDAHVHNLRRKLELHGIDNVLVTVRSVGYRFR